MELINMGDKDADCCAESSKEEKEASESNESCC